MLWLEYTKQSTINPVGSPTIIMVELRNYTLLEFIDDADSQLYDKNNYWNALKYDLFTFVVSDYITYLKKDIFTPA